MWEQLVPHDKLSTCEDRDILDQKLAPNVEEECALEKQLDSVDARVEDPVTDCANHIYINVLESESSLGRFEKDKRERGDDLKMNVLKEED